MDILDLSTDPKQGCFAAYLNMAQNNVFIAMKDIVERLGLKKTFYKNGKEDVNPFDESNCHEATILQEKYLNALPDDQKEKLKRKLLNSFPFLVPMISTDRFYAFYNKHTLYYAKEKNEKEISSDVTIRKEEQLLQNSKVETIAEYLRNSLKVLSFYRNNASHTLAITDEIGREIISESNMIAIALDCVFKQACAVIKERFQLKGNDKNGKNLQFIQNARVLPKDIGKKDKKGRAIKIQVPNFNYSHCFYYKDNNEYTMSRMAVVYLICMFIDKSYATQFFNKISTEFYRGIYKNEDYKMYMREIYSCYRIRMPKNATNPYEDNIILAMDILNELAKCPNELYECLSEEDQARFERDNSAQADCPDRVLLRRSTDRFPQLALKWIDSNKIFKNLRFKVIYGKYHDLFKDDLQNEPGIKKCCDGIVRPRWITKALTTFGRINEVEAQRDGSIDSWDGVQLIKKVDDEGEDTETAPDTNQPWITDMFSQYVIDEGNIGLKTVQGDTTLPPIKDKTIKDVRTSAPDYWLGIYELPAFVFLSILNADAVENLIAGYKNKFVSFLNKLRNGEIQPVDSEDDLKEVIKNQGLVWKDIPDKIKKCLLNRRANFQEYAERYLQEELAYTDRQIKDREDCKKGVELIEPSRFLPGKIGKWLSTDIVKYCKFKEGKDKPTGLNYNVMQSKLATFAHSSQLADIVRMFQQLKMTRGGNAEHPFLQAVLDFEPKNVVQFFGKYLAEKISYLDKAYKKCMKSPNSCKSLHFLHPNKSKWQVGNIAKLAEEYLKLPIQLPKGLFDKAIKNNILSVCPELKDKETTTVSYMINAYMLSKDDDIQDFYKVGRSYPVFEKMDKAKPGKNPRENGEVKYRTKAELHKKGFFEAELSQYIYNCKKDPKKHRDFDEESATTKLKSLFNAYDRTEKAITRYSVQDFLLMLIAEKLLFNQQIKKGKKQGDALSTLSIDLFKLQNIGPDYDKALLSEIVEIPINLQNGYTVTWETKIKDYARIYKIYGDRRLPKLLGLLPKGNYQAEDIRWEFDNYDRKRIEVFSLLLDLEKKALQIPSVKEANDQYVAENGHANFNTIFAALLDYLGFNDTEKAELQMIIDIRNSFAHGDYLDIGTKPASLKDASNNIIAKLNELIDKVMAKM